VPKAVAEKNLHGLAFFLAPISAPPKRVDLSSYLVKCWGEKWYLSQGDCGCCVACGAALACDVLMAIDTVRNASGNPTSRTDVHTIYWGSRVEIGKNRIQGEGSVGVWACEYLKTYGALPQKKYPEVDLSKFSPSLCCSQQSYKGVPDTLEPTARQHPVKTYAQVKSFDEAVYALAEGFPITIASSQGFRMELDANGFGRPSGTWNHQQCIVAYELEPTPCLWIANSWDACYRGGPPGWCPAVMKVDKRTVDRMLKEGDSWALSQFEGFRGPGLDFSRLNF
jgi:hypothetical protein